MNLSTMMFKQSRRKIVVAIMSILILLWVGTLGVIYAFSYIEMSRQNQEMLKTHSEMYVLKQPEDVMPKRPDSERHEFLMESPRFQLSTFYTVALSYDGKVLEIKNEQTRIHTDEELQALSTEILENDISAGTKNNLVFYKTDKGGYILITFMDNTVINEGAWTIFRYTLIFGGIALIVFFFLAQILAKKIVQPLEENDRKQKQFISDAGHELKTPVSVVRTNAELLSREIGENPWLLNIQYENERMRLLIQQLLELARTENVSPVMEKVNFSRLCCGESLPFESVAFEQNLVMHTDIAEGIFIDGDASQLKQLISILLDNAIRHSVHGNTVFLNLTKEHRYAKLSVINSGEEMNSEQRKRIFERFYRVDCARNSEDKHYGLGLAIAKTIVDGHKGSIEVLCNSGLVEFRVLFPINHLSN